MVSALDQVSYCRIYFRLWYWLRGRRLENDEDEEDNGAYGRKTAFSRRARPHMKI
jgi:hypothetical protein